MATPVPSTISTDSYAHASSAAPWSAIKVWRSDGRVVYSDKRELIGTRYLLEDDERMALADGRVDAGISDLSRPENRFGVGVRLCGQGARFIQTPIRAPSGSARPVSKPKLVRGVRNPPVMAPVK